MRKYVDELFTVIIEMLQDASSLVKREVCFIQLGYLQCIKICEGLSLAVTTDILLSFSKAFKLYTLTFLQPAFRTFKSTENKAR